MLRYNHTQTLDILFLVLPISFFTALHNPQLSYSLRISIGIL